MAGKDRYDWSEIDPYLKEHYLTENAKDIAKKFNMKPSQIRDRAKLLGIRKQTKHKWTDEDKQYIIDNYAHTRAPEIAKVLGVSVYSVNKMAQSLGVRAIPKDEYVNVEGYKCLGKSSHRKLEHRKVMEEYLGRELSPDEIVHHIDGNKLNNDISNLQLVTRAEHINIHRKELLESQGKKSRVNAIDDIV